MSLKYATHPMCGHWSKRQLWYPAMEPQHCKLDNVRSEYFPQAKPQIQLKQRPARWPINDFLQQRDPPVIQVASIGLPFVVQMVCHLLGIFRYFIIIMDRNTDRPVRRFTEATRCRIIVLSTRWEIVFNRFCPTRPHSSCLSTSESFCAAISTWKGLVCKKPTHPSKIREW